MISPSSVELGPDEGRTKTGDDGLHRSPALAAVTIVTHLEYPHLENQANRLWAYAGQNGMLLDDVVSEVASGLNDRRPKLRKLLSDPTVHTMIVEHRERLARFGVGMVEAMLQARGGALIVIDDAEVPDDLVRDMTEILTCFCARLYGKRSAANKARRAMEAASG